MIHDKIKFFLRRVCEKLVKIDDSPQRIALGFALGVFMGILPGVGPLASLALAVVFKINRVAALAGSVLTNTWFSVVSFVLAVKIGAVLTGTNGEELYSQCKFLFQDFHWKRLFDVAIIKMLKPLAVGYGVIGVGAGLMAYGVTLSILKWKARKKD